MFKDEPFVLNTDEVLVSDRSSGTEDALALLAPDVDEQEYLANIEVVRGQLLNSGLTLLELYGEKTVGIPISMSHGYRARVVAKKYPKDKVPEHISHRVFVATPEVTLADAACWLEVNQGLVPGGFEVAMDTIEDPNDGSISYSRVDPKLVSGFTLCVKRAGQDEPAFFHVDRKRTYNSLLEEARLEELQGAVFLLGQVEKALSTQPPAQA